MKKRQRPEALKPVDRPTWLVTRDQFGTPLHVTELAAGADPQDVLTAAMQSLEKQGWRIDEPFSNLFAGFFCQLGELRVMVGICPEHPRERTCEPKPQMWTNSQ